MTARFELKIATPRSSEQTFEFFSLGGVFTFIERLPSTRPVLSLWDNRICEWLDHKTGLVRQLEKMAPAI